jgi:uncharacterized iron-regulated protein
LGDIQNEINSGATLTNRAAWNKEGDVIGFHVTEYLLYREGKTRPVNTLSSAELNYLVAATDALVWDCVLAYVAWKGEDYVSDDIKKVFRENQAVVDHLDYEDSYYKNFAQKLTTKTGYSSWGDALSEIAIGASDIAGEVGATKIEQPYTDGLVEDVESWYSWHSLDDYQNNIRSIKNAYLGGRGDDSRESKYSLSRLIAKINPEFDNRIQNKIEDCLTKINVIGIDKGSFYKVVENKKKNGLDPTDDARVNAAVNACVELQRLFDSIADIL